MQEKPQPVIDAERRAEELTAPFVEQVMSTIHSLIEEVEATKLPSRFKRNVSVAEIQQRLRPDEMLSNLAQTRIENEGEAGYKRAQLLGNLRASEAALLRFANELKVIIVDIEITKLEDDSEK